ncbi:helicase [Thiopseudomonas alkaliphila]|uniref:DEAD/DEAH box helicase n=1 Tax=Thiopseudomonas alkaliphila TaxID=1697053 RepID=UPI00069D43C8|nr:DEAD/DEAH box helicase [Thiopseudomonas alkaliphila]AKX55351.1 helicase [Thiopseudomonas alkaliphila]
MLHRSFAPGIRVEIRDAEWRVKCVDRTSDGGELLTCEGLSELVRGREATFLTKLEQVRVLAPEDTSLVDDTSSGYRASLLYLATLIRQAPPVDNKIYLGQHAALDVMAYQLEPALQALQQPRQRILIADSVGLGKTLEAGILVSELIARGKGKRILVLAVKSMLTQFQQEFWNRFSIGLTRLDSQGLQRVRNRIPSNHNPFHYFDRSIISIDTLKQDIDYRHYLEQAYWDIIIIDEAHNVAERSSHSQRARLAKLLATRSDTLIMLSATPHDGKPESFASLVNMLDPTAIANPSDYAKEDFRDKGLVIRRFKDDIREQLSNSFPDRDISTLKSPASLAEEHAYQTLLDAEFKTLKGAGAGQLFRTTLTKALFSSPAALLSTVNNRQQRLQRSLATAKTAEQRDNISADLDNLQTVAHAVKNINAKNFSKYQQLVALLRQDTPEGKHFAWNPQQADDRLVIFTESIPTLEFLAEHLPKDCALKKNQLLILRGDMSDKDLAATVDNFNQRTHPARLLICSDVASEGINLHHLSHRMVHFDIPWSLMVFQQRNGRIDRYGQTRQPLIRYLLTDSQNAKIKGDNRILEVLIEKDQQAGKNIGDPSEFSQTEGEALTAELIERDTQPDVDLDALLADFFSGTDEQGNTPVDSVAAFTPATGEHTLDAMLGQRPRIFNTDLEYASAAVTWLQQEGGLPLQVDIDNEGLRLTAPADLQQRRRFLPREVWPANDRFALTINRERISDELKRCREEDSPWPQVHFLWPLHPVMQWLYDRSLNAFGRHTAPVVRIPQQLGADEHWVLLHGGFPNRRGQMQLHSWCAVQLQGQQVVASCTLTEFLQRLDLSRLVNLGQPGATHSLSALLPLAIAHAKQQLITERAEYEQRSNQWLNTQLAELDALRQRHLQQMEIELSSLSSTQQQSQRANRQQEIERLFDDYLEWLENTQLLDEQPYLQVAAVFTGQPQAV